MTATVLSAGGCAGVDADYLLLDRFFAASRLLDRTELARYATTVFHPTHDGIVVRFSVVSTSSGGGPEPLAFGQDGQHARVVELSLSDPTSLGVSTPAPPATVETRHVTVAAYVRSPATAPVSRRTLDVTLQRAEGRGRPRRQGRWIVTGVRMRER